MWYINRREFVKFTSSGVLFFFVPYSTFLVEARNRVYVSEDYDGGATKVDEILRLVGEIRSELAQVSQEVLYTSNFCAKLFSLTSQFESYYQKGVYFGLLRNKLYNSFINLSVIDFNSEIVIFSQFIKKSFSKALSSGAFQINASSGVTKIVPDLNRSTFNYKNDIIDNVFDISMPVKIISPGGSFVNKILRLAVNIYNTNYGKTKCDLISYPIFLESDGSKSDPVDSLPINSRAEFRSMIVSNLTSTLDKIDLNVSIPHVDSVNYNFRLRNIVLHNGLRLLSNSSGVCQRNEFSNERLPSYILSGKSAALFIKPKYSNQLLSSLISTKVKLDIPTEFNYTITVSSIDQHDQSTADFRIIFNGQYSYNWVVTDATVTVNVDSHYLVKFIKYLKQTNLVAKQISYRLEVEASGFPPFGIGPKSPDDAVNETMNSVRNAMEEDALIRFAIATPDTEIQFSDGGLMILINTL